MSPPLRRNRTPLTFESALRYAREWDVDVVIEPESRSIAREAISHYGPVCGGIHWPSRTIIWPVDDVDQFHIAPFIHELSHVLSDLDPKWVSELDSSVVALDHAAFMFLGAPRLWNVWMASFHTPTGTWPELTKRERDDFLIGSQCMAATDGLLDDNGRPTFKRKRAEASRAA